MEKQTLPYSERDRKYAWDYFSIHSSQRISTFNFYITLALATSTATATALQPSINLPIISLVLSVVLILISFVFYKLDQRNKMLIKCAEKALKESESRIEKTESFSNSLFSLFQNDELYVKERRSKKSFWFWNNYYSYSDCFNLVFTIFILIGILGITFGIASII